MGEKVDQDETDLQEEGRGGGRGRLLAGRAPQAPQGCLQGGHKVTLWQSTDVIGVCPKNI